VVPLYGVLETFAKRPLLPPAIGGMTDSTLQAALEMQPAPQNIEPI